MAQQMPKDLFFLWKPHACIVGLSCTWYIAGGEPHLWERYHYDGLASDLSHSKASVTWGMNREHDPSLPLPDTLFIGLSYKDFLSFRNHYLLQH